MGNVIEIQHIIKIKYANIQQDIILKNQVYSVGRHSSNTIVIHHPTISRYHCSILPVKYKDESQQELFWIIDGDLKGNRSANGLFVNGNKCLSHELKSGDKINIGGDEVIVNYLVNNTNNYEDISINEKNLINNDFIDNDKDTIFQDVQLNTTLINKEEQENFFIQEILFILHNENTYLTCPLFIIDLEEKITHTNSFFKSKFTDFRETYKTHPFIKNIVSSLQETKKDFYLREVKYQDQYYTQYAHFIDNKTQIKSYIFSFSQRDKIEKALRENEEKYRAVVRQISEGIILVDPVTKQIIEANNAYCSLMGYSDQEILSLKLYDLVAADPDVSDSIIKKVQKKRLNLIQESIHRHRDGSLIQVEVNVTTIYCSAKEFICYAVRDITERKLAEEMLRYQACHDLLTELGNRNLFNEQLHKAIARAQRYKNQFAVIFIDLDRFKNINDTLGHDIGDRFLQGVAHRVRTCLRNADLIARWGGDEFTILLSEIKHSQDAAIVGERILKALKQPFQILEYKLYAYLSMGIAIYPQDGDNLETILKNADTALYRMKDQGGNNYQYYNPSMNQKKTQLLRMEECLYEAIKNNQFQLYYQPQINIKTCQIVGMEALIRWQHPELGRVSPEQFIPIAEQTGLINSIGEWVLFNACQQNKTWQKLGLPPFKMSVNLSARQFQKQNLVSIFSNILKQTQLEAKYLELEITETSIIDHPELTKDILDQLTNLGISISMDDFGSGYSSLGYLKKFPFNKIKIDQSFVRELKNVPQDLAIISAVITLGKGFNLQVVAEGIETQEQLNLLKDLQCEIMQGYFFSHPLPVDEATNFLITTSQQGLSF
ncbi:MAG: EAL domain-containing protein [Cyanobacteria bacterium]|nr:EAL domain-containing protein [Cyanobacteria bacterium CG_2015-16_32_12]NCO79163.1 EAL domain-containing protein [Cyanobacteria bacterium CG_2015-22_32_23]NCQ04880.1 EAL domain-containing protein [Cyanobacteria bacterium CG_2015-09_32_10]NCQ41243.1 EAL domain-containing protein [Cyanobacteria bacterium CG_2015-04_32_10]NCS84992.1 EAL domain-containing protein [Cyanobacteria bacterium CG_2015-02_32_10]